MYGHQIGFNINGEDVYKTTPGACASVTIFIVLAIVAQYLLREIVFENLDKPLTTILHPNYFEDVPLK